MTDFNSNSNSNKEESIKHLEAIFEAAKQTIMGDGEGKSMLISVTIPDDKTCLTLILGDVYKVTDGKTLKNMCMAFGRDIGDAIGHCLSEAADKTDIPAEAIANVIADTPKMYGKLFCKHMSTGMLKHFTENTENTKNDKRRNEILMNAAATALMSVASGPGGPKQAMSLLKSFMKQAEDELRTEGHTKPTGMSADDFLAGLGIGAANVEGPRPSDAQTPPDSPPTTFEGGSGDFGGGGSDSSFGDDNTSSPASSGGND